MRYITLAEAKPGMIVANTIEDSYKRYLIERNHELSEANIVRLRELGYAGLYIKDDWSAGINVQPVISGELRKHAMGYLKKGDVNGCRSVADKMAGELIRTPKNVMDMVDVRSLDDYTRAHSVNVAVLSGVMGLAMGMSDNQIMELVLAGLLHDLGKMTIDDEILNKPGRLTPEEYQIMKGHAVRSYEMICNQPDIPSEVKYAVRYHHENVDGSGYPEGLDGNQQTLYTKIIHVVDVYDALVSARPYKSPLSPVEAAEYMMGASGIMFDQQVVKEFLLHVPLYPKGTTVKLSNGEIGVIFDNTGRHNLRPIIRLSNRKLLDLDDPMYYNVTILPRKNENTLLQNAEEERKLMIEGVKKPRILAVDDMKTNLQQLRSILSEEYDLTLIRSGSQAIAFLKNGGALPDVILMDIDMPGINGIEAAREIMQMTNNKIPVLFVTALADKETVLACRALNAGGYIIRPYVPVYMKSEIRRLLTGRSVTE